MNKTWSIILIVVACIVVLGGTYWYFGMQKPKTQEGPTPSAVVEPAKAQPKVAMDNPVAPSKDKEGTPGTEPKKAPVAGPVEENAVQENDPVEIPKGKALPSPVPPSIIKGGKFAIPTFGDTHEEGLAEQGMQTSVLASETLPDTSGKNLSSAVTEEAEPEPIIGTPVEKDELLPSDSPANEEIELQQRADDVVTPPIAKKTIEELPEVELKTTPKELPEVDLKPTPTVQEMPTTTPSPKDMVATTAEEISPTQDKPALETNISVSFLDYNFPKDFSPAQKGFNISLDLMSQKEVFGWGGTLEVGNVKKADNTNIVEVSLLAKTAWKLGKGVVTFPLSISLGPTLFIDSAKTTPEFGMKAKFSAGITYAISESFRFFYAVGIGATYNFQDNSSFRFVLEPIRVGVGFSF